LLLLQELSWEAFCSGLGVCREITRSEVDLESFRFRAKYGAPPVLEQSFLANCRNDGHFSFLKPYEFLQAQPEMINDVETPTRNSEI